MQNSFPFSPVDLGDIPPLAKADIQIFTTNSLNVNWFSWTKPRGATMTSMIAIAGGGGGGGGFTRTAGTAGGGGAGGACSGIARLIIPTFFLPDTLYVQVGIGGTGGAANGAGVNATNSYVSYGHSIATPNVLLASGANAPGGGGAGAVGAGGTGGTVPTIATTVTSQSMGWWFATVGLVGAAGGSQAGANGTPVTSWAAVVLSPGAGGAGCTTTDFSGGSQNMTAAADFGIQNFPAIWAVMGGFATTNVDGGGGIMLYQPFYMTGGSGGGSNNSGQGGNGGKGGIGCGGGGGGAGTTGGRGGDGGNGMVSIISW